MKCGLRPAEYWSQLPSETFEFIEAAVWRATEEQRTAVMGAYFSEVFARAKRLPPLEDVLSKVFRKNQPRTLEEKVAAARAFLGVKKKKAS